MVCEVPVVVLLASLLLRNQGASEACVAHRNCVIDRCHVVLVVALPVASTAGLLEVVMDLVVLMSC